jgi:carboxypeptidase family protein/TonB-dependent receptor-like protein
MTHFFRGARATALLRATFLVGTSLPALAGLHGEAHAQDYTNVTASGRVTGEDGAPIAGAIVALTSSDRGINRTATTNDSGTYTIPQLAPGNYDIVVTADGYATYKEAGVALTRNNGAANSFSLVASSASDNAIVVNGERLVINDFEDATIGATINVADIDQRVPIARSLQDIVMMAPGAVRGSSGANAGFADQVAISGASFIENAFYVNGLNITNFRMGLQPVEVPYDFYKTVEVKTGGMPAEFGRATGGVVNAVTKSGSNDFHAGVLGTWEPQGMRESSPATYSTNNESATQDRHEIVMQGSGPIIRDHLFVYGLYSIRKFESLTPDQDQDNATRVVNDSPFWGVKVDGYITDDHHLEFTYFDTTNETRTRSIEYDRATGKEGAETGGTNGRGGGKNYVARYTGTVTPWLTVSGAYGVNKLRDGTLPLDIDNERVLDYRQSDAGIDIGLNKVTDAYGYTTDEREFFRGDVDLTFDMAGFHHLRLGYDHETDTSEQVHQTMGQGFFKIFTANADTAERLGIAEGTDYYTTRVYRNNGISTVKNEAFYIEDDWALMDDRLRLQLGLRNDRFSNQGVNGESYYESGNQWAPRVGASYDLLGDGRTKLYGFYGKYYLPLAADINLNVMGGRETYTRYNLLNGLDPAKGTPLPGDAILGGDGLRACPDTGIANCEVQADGSPADPSGAIANNLKPQSADEFIVGAEHRLSNSIKLGAYFTHRELGNVIEDLTVDFGARAYCVDQGFSEAECTAAYPGGSNWVIANPGGDIEVQINPLPDGSKPTVTLAADDLGYDKPKRHYNAVTLTFDREFDGKWGLSANYTWAMSKGNYEGGVRSENGQLAVNRVSDFDSPGFQNGSYGYLPNDRRHTLKLFGSYRPFEFLDLGVNTLVQSPRSYSCIGTVPQEVDPYAHGYHGYSYYCNDKLVPRGTAFKGDWIYNVDVSAVARLPLDGLDASVRFDIFNLFNSKGVTAYNEFGQLSNDAPNSNYGKPEAYQTPRYARVQFRLGF